MWVLAQSLSVPRGDHTATLLYTGQVLIAGGVYAGATNAGLASARLYHPWLGTWTPTGSLTGPRDQQTATLLRSGKVLIVGGEKDNDVINTADLYDPATSTFTSTGEMHVGRVAHTATLLPNGQVLVTGGCSGVDTACATTWGSADLYNPATGMFTSTGSMSTPRQWHTATLLPNGQVLIVGGASCGACYPLASAELYNPATGVFTATGSLHIIRASHTATLLRTGKVLIAGGCTNTAGGCFPAGSILASAELHDPATGQFSYTGSMTTTRSAATATLLPSGRVLIAGGNGPPGPVAQPLASAELYDPATGTFIGTASMSTARQGNTATLLPTGGVLVTGGCFGNSGVCGNPVLSSAEIYYGR